MEMDFLRFLGLSDQGFNRWRSRAAAFRPEPLATTDLSVISPTPNIATKLVSFRCQNIQGVCTAFVLRRLEWAPNM